MRYPPTSPFRGSSTAWMLAILLTGACEGTIWDAADARDPGRDAQDGAPPADGGPLAADGSPPAADGSPPSDGRIGEPDASVPDRDAGPPMPLRCEGEATGADVDLDVLYIERTPRYDFSATPNAPSPGDEVTYRAHVRNNGTVASMAFEHAWTVDDYELARGVGEPLDPGEEAVFEHTVIWDGERHRVAFGVDCPSTVAEISELNNVVEIVSDAIAVGLWVERGLHAWFGEHQRRLGIGSVSWEDWAQRQIREWNRIFRESTYPAFPEGTHERARLDRVVVVDDGALPLDGLRAAWSTPAKDETVDVMWGFPSDPGASPYHRGFYDGEGGPRLTMEESNQFYIDYILLHELSHARYLVDWYAWNFNPHPGMDDVLVTRRDGSRFVPPSTKAFFACSGGMMRCVAPEGRERLYDDVDVWALERIRGQRARCGNQNAPCNLGEFQMTLPADNRVRVLSGSGAPVEGALVEVFRSVAEPGERRDLYDKRVDAVPDLSCTTDADGECSLGAEPFGPIPTNWDAGFRGVALLRARAGSGEAFRWLYLSDTAREIMAGHTAVGIYEMTDPSLAP